MNLSKAGLKAVLGFWGAMTLLAAYGGLIAYLGDHYSYGWVILGFVLPFITFLSSMIYLEHKD